MNETVVGRGPGTQTLTLPGPAAHWLWLCPLPHPPYPLIPVSTVSSPIGLSALVAALLGTLTCYPWTSYPLLHLPHSSPVSVSARLAAALFGTPDHVPTLLFVTFPCQSCRPQTTLFPVAQTSYPPLPSPQFHLTPGSSSALYPHWVPTDLFFPTVSLSLPLPAW